VSLRDAVIDHNELAEAFQNSSYGQLVAAIPEPTGKTIIQKAQQSFVMHTQEEGGKASFGLQLKELCKRAISFVFREPLLLKVRIFQTLFMSLLTGLIFLQLPNSLTGASNKISGGFFVAVNPLFTGINGPTATFPPERAVYWRENGAGLYSAGAYFMSKLVAEVPVNLVSPVIFGTIAWWMMGLNYGADRFFEFLLIEVILTTLGYAIGIVINLAIYDPGIVQRVQPLILLPLMVFAGFFLNSNSVPDWLVWLEDISPLKYAFRATMNVVLAGLPLYCQYSDLREVDFVPLPLNRTLDPTISVLSSNSTSVLVCPTTSGDQLLAGLGMQGYSIWVDIIIITAMMGFFMVLSFILLVFRKPQF